MIPATVQYPRYQRTEDTMSKSTEWIDTATAAELMETTRANVTYLCRANKIRCEKFGRDWMVNKQDAEDYIKSAREGRKQDK